MDFYQFFQLFKRHLLLLILVPFVLALSVYLFTRNQPKTYFSETTIYTGIATGYSIESTESRFMDYYGTNVQFDNLINLFFSRKTIEETAIRLLAQDLILETPNPQYISKQNHEDIHQLAPEIVKDLVVKNGKMGLERKREEQIENLEKEIQSLEREIDRKKTVAEEALSNPTDINIPVDAEPNTEPQKKKTTEQTANKTRFHTVSSGESIYYIANYYGLTVGELIEMNDLNSNRVRPGQILIVRKSEAPTANAYHTVRAGESLYSIAREYDVSISKIKELNNLRSNSLEVGQRLLIEGTIRSTPQANFDKEVSSSYLDGDRQDKTTDPQDEDESRATTLQEYTFKVNRMDQGPQKDPIVPPGINPSDFQATVENFYAYYKSSDTNFIYELLHYTHKHYSIRAITQNAKVNRMNNSDLIKVTYTSDDPGMCQQTLKIIAEVFIKNYKQLRINQTDAVINYFQNQVDSANARLQRAEDRLLQFNKKNNIINYNEQSKFIAEQKEDLDVYYQNQQIRMAASNAAMQELETKLVSKDSIYLSTDEIQKVRQKLMKIEETIFINELDSENDPRIGNKLEKLRFEAAQLTDRLKYLVDKYYMYSHSPEGIPVKEILSEWIDNVMEFEKSKAALRVLERRKSDFQEVYQVMAPLGAMLKRIEREIDVAEQSYLELLRSLNLAKMKQQNLEMATNIKIVDEPFFPISPNPSRTKILVLVAAIAGFVLVAFLILMLEYFDTSIKSPDRAQKLIKLKLAGAYPRFGPGVQTAEFKNAAERLIEIIIQNIKLAIGHHSLYSSEKPYLILIFSTKPNVGKTTITNNLIRKFREYGEKVLYLNYNRGGDEENNQPENDLNYTVHYKIDNHFVEINHVKELLEKGYIRQKNYNYDYIFLEIPAIIYNSFPLELMDTVDLSLLVVKAKDYWKNADQAALNTMLEVSREKPLIVLNQAEVYALEDIMHNIPHQKGRSIRKSIRKITSYPSKFKIRVKVD